MMAPMIASATIVIPVGPGLRTVSCLGARSGSRGARAPPGGKTEKSKLTAFLSVKPIASIQCSGAQR